MLVCYTHIFHVVMADHCHPCSRDIADTCRGALQEHQNGHDMPAERERGREGGREGGKEGGRERGSKGGSEGGREEGREGVREGGRKGGRE